MTINGLTAETAYLFRHAMVREAAYELQLPSDRAQLHALALELLESMLDVDEVAANADELALHAELAGRHDTWRRYLELAARNAARRFDHATAATGLRRLATDEEADTESRVAQALESATQFRAAGRPKQEQPMVELAGRLLERHNVPALRARLLLARSAIASTRGQPQEVRAFVKEARRLYDESGDLLGVSRCVFSLANLELGAGQTDEAIGLFEQALALNRELESSEHIAITQASLGPALAIKGRADEAVAMMEAACDYFAQVNNLPMLGRIYSKFGYTMAKLGRREAALDRGLQALPILRRTGDVPFLSITLNNVAGSLVMLRRFGEAEAYFMEALDLAREHGLVSSLSLVFGDLGVLYEQDGRLQAAERAFRKGIELSIQSGQIPRRITLTINLGNVLASLGRENEAEDAFHESLDLLQETPARGQRGLALMNLGNLRRLQGRLNAAVGLYRMADEDFRMADLVEWRIDTLSHQADCHMLLGEPNEARRCLEEGFAMCTPEFAAKRIGKLNPSKIRLALCSGQPDISAAEALFDELDRYVTDNNVPFESDIAKASRLMNDLIEAAREADGEPFCFGAHLPEELNTRESTALLDRLRTGAAGDFETLSTQHPKLVARYEHGDVEVPDWRGAEEI